MGLKNYGMCVGDYCRHKSSPRYGWAKIIEIGYFGKTYKIAKCEWALDKDSVWGFIKYFALRDIIKTESEGYSVSNEKIEKQIEKEMKNEK